MVLERVQKIIAQSGMCSRRKAEELIFAGKVIVNNKTIKLGDKADSAKDVIRVDGRQIKIEKKVYYMLNKPRDYITTSDDMYGRKKVIDLVPPYPRVFAVGRLDRDCQGIIILTNDGEFANKIMHPRYQIKKVYEVILHQPFNKKDVTKFKQGVSIDGRIVKSDIKVISTSVVEVSLHVGLHKVVKRLFKETGYYVKKLSRKKIGHLTVNIPVGHYRKLTEKDLDRIFEK